MGRACCLLWKSTQQLWDLLLRSSSEMPFLCKDAKFWLNNCFLAKEDLGLRCWLVVCSARQKGPSGLTKVQSRLQSCPVQRQNCSRTASLSGQVRSSRPVKAGETLTGSYIPPRSPEEAPFSLPNAREVPLVPERISERPAGVCTGEEAACAAAVSIMILCAKLRGET